MNDQLTQSHFKRSHSLEELAVMQGVTPPMRAADLYADILRKSETPEAWNDAIRAYRDNDLPSDR